MTTPTSESLADAMRTGVDNRPVGRLKRVATTEQPAPFAVPLDQDAYEVALDHIERDPSQPRKSFDEAELAVLRLIPHFEKDDEGFRAQPGDSRRWEMNIRWGEPGLDPKEPAAPLGK